MAKRKNTEKVIRKSKPTRGRGDAFKRTGKQPDRRK